MKIGITGVHGCGKTCISTIFSEKNYKYVKNPFTFDSEVARAIANNPEIDEIEKAFIFLEDRLRCFLEIENLSNVVTDRWWLDVCINVNFKLLPIFFDFYSTPVFLKDFIGIYLNVKPELASNREDIFSLAKIQEQKVFYTKAIELLYRGKYTEKFRFIEVDVGTKSEMEIYKEIIGKIEN